MKYLKVVQKASDIVDVVVPSVYYIKDTEEVKYYGDAFRPLTFVAREDGMTVSFTKPCSYSLDCSTWVELAANTATPAINTGEQISFRKEVAATTSSIGKFSSNKTFDLKGNIMSMLFGQNFIEKNSLNRYNRCFQGLFQSSFVVDASKLYLPATTLAGYCYTSMFQGCSSLTSAPNLPATTLEGSCYYTMFKGCTSLTSAPELPATTLADSCYFGMFEGCSSLTSAPNLPATTLEGSCYYTMFYGCTSLTSAPELPATTLAGNCYNSMFYGCTSLTQAPNLPAITLVTYCYYSMFYGCTSLTSAPELPATTLAEACYASMFEGCPRLTSAPELPATTLATYCYYHMFYSCSSLTRIIMLATNISASNALRSWVMNVSAQGTFIKAAGVTIPNGSDGIPNGWTVEER